MSNLKRIDPASVPGVFRRIRRKPVQCRYGIIGRSVGPCCCVEIAIAIDRVGVRAAVKAFVSDTAAYEAAIGTSGDYASGLRNGWDDNGRARNRQERFGYADGRAAWQACIAANLVSELTP